MEFAGENGKSTFVACQDKDYALALENELSDRWMRAFRRSDLVSPRAVLLAYNF